MKVVGYSIILFIFPFIIVVIAASVVLTVLLWPKIKAIKKENLDIVDREHRPLSRDEIRNMKGKLKEELNTEFDTEGQKELLSELLHGDLKDLFKPDERK